MSFTIAWPPDRLSANVTMLFPDVPVAERPAAAAHAGFRLIESWWPFSTELPTREEIAAFAGAVAAAEVSVSALNFSSGVRARGERGIAASPSKVERFAAHSDVAIEVAKAVGAPVLNLLYGNLEPGADFPSPTAVASISATAEAAASAGIRLMVEPLSALEAPDYALRTMSQARELGGAVLATCGVRIGVCADIYQLSLSDPAGLTTIESFADDIFNVQLADTPGRHEPGTGTLPIAETLSRLATAGYDGTVALEYRPTTPVRLPEHAQEP